MVFEVIKTETSFIALPNHERKNDEARSTVQINTITMLGNADM